MIYAISTFENQVAFNPSYYVKQVTTNVSGSTITISAGNLTDYYNSVKLLDFSNQSESDYGTILAICSDFCLGL